MFRRNLLFYQGFLNLPLEPKMQEKFKYLTYKDMQQDNALSKEILKIGKTGPKYLVKMVVMVQGINIIGDKND